MAVNDKETLLKIIKYCDDIELLMHQYGYSYERYNTEIAFQYSCNMCIIQIGELVGRLSDNIIEKYEDIPWHAIRAMRNLHAHDYEKVDMDIVWNTLTTEISELKSQLENIVQKI